MHPAPSIIGFTVASGAGYGLLALAIIAAILGLLPDDRLFAFTVMALGTGLVGAGLVSSTFHLGHPERAWRALSQWRTSWLSREGLAALVTFVPLGIFGIGWVFLGATHGAWALAGLLAVAGAVVSVACTAMIYASLKPIRAWHTPWTPTTYYLLALASGSVLLAALLHLFSAPAAWADGLALAALAAAWSAKLGYWRDIDTAPIAGTPESATRLGFLGRVRQIVPPHTEENYLLKEMGFRVARKHAARLRQLALGAGFVLPAVFIALAWLAGGGIATVLVVLAAASTTLGAVTERWLFFAEARHAIVNYYQ
ncbi:MAG: dimethyl sulfoxide reductase anchor subunit family protein [Hyphomicrobiales bacterium]